MRNYNNKNNDKEKSKPQSFTVSEPIGLLDFLFENMKGKGVNKVK